jgi:hypothetical protein
MEEDYKANHLERLCYNFRVPARASRLFKYFFNPGHSRTSAPIHEENDSLALRELFHEAIQP